MGEYQIKFDSFNLDKKIVPTSGVEFSFLSENSCIIETFNISFLITIIYPNIMVITLGANAGLLKIKLYLVVHMQY